MSVNVKLLNDTLEAIKGNPDHWEQTQWHCGTSHCFAGFVEVLHFGLPICSSSGTLKHDGRIYIGVDVHGGTWVTRDNATEALGIHKEDAKELFSAVNTLEDLTKMVAYLSTNGTLEGYGDNNEDSEGWSNED